MRKFPPLFLMLFFLYILYVFSFPLGFTYVAFFCFAATVALAMLYFSNHVVSLRTIRGAARIQSLFSLGFASVLNLTLS